MCADRAKTASAAKTKFDFRVFSTCGQIEDVTFYFIESTAPDNVEQRVADDDRPPKGLTLVEPDKAVTEIAEQLVPSDEPEVDTNLIVMVHGFNNPRESVLTFYKAAIEALKKDKDAIFSKSRRIVCIGYHWPSEATGSVRGSSLSALPLFPLWLFGGACAVLALRLWGWVASLPLLLFDLAWLLTPPAFALIAITAVVALLRAIVYFRDIYRATNYGVPDLVEVIRQIDLEASNLVDAEAAAGKKARPRIALSFIGHSMGGLVVTNVIRVLSDVFDRAVIRTYLSGQERDGPASDTPEGVDQVSGKIGHVFTLMRFVLASPDIPAETLLADRANFLASSLRRFREAYLFSSEGDEVLRLISTTANYFSFPTQKRNFGYRLGNVEILSSGFGSVSNHGLSGALRVGREKLAALSVATRRKQHPARENQHPAQVAEAFTYFDCTDYIDAYIDAPGQRGFLTEAHNYKAQNPEGRIPYREHVKLLWRYLKSEINVHGGYFEGTVTQRLIYRLACLGFEDAMQAYVGGEPAMLAECSDHHIRVMRSRRLEPRIQGLRKPREEMETPGMLDAQIKDLQSQLKKSQSDIEVYEMAFQKRPSKTVEEKDGVLCIGDIRIDKKPSD